MDKHPTNTAVSFYGSRDQDTNCIVLDDAVRQKEVHTISGS